MENKLQPSKKSNKIIPIIIAILGTLYGVSPIDAIPDVVPVVGWIDDLIITGGSLIGLIQAYTEDTNKNLAKIFGILKWSLWLLGGILIVLIAILGITTYNLFK
ncbi:DUF1232 domain-containing protein [Chryseobacterium sp. APV1]|uniref:DUF1232 domain-containing protein n=1 Tax=Chryseobacterium urinae TaxID=3058400 RepID=A0ABT8U466_9FLAO|nr:DUF1232 domain-containing protein [Chryseobacterium sp. APV1]MDO3425868.1 DUF1232 domain-containing protein [Chryseobacterium sp. APV1]